MSADASWVWTTGGFLILVGIAFIVVAGAGLLIEWRLRRRRG